MIQGDKTIMEFEKMHFIDHGLRNTIDWYKFKGKNGFSGFEKKDSFTKGEVAFDLPYYNHERRNLWEA